MIAIPNMDKPKTCIECFLQDECEHNKDTYWIHEERPHDCPLIEIDENNLMLLEFLNEFDKWRAYKELMDFIRMAQKKGEANEKHR